MENKTPDIYGYLDYREYLHDVYVTRKKSQRGFSYRSFARKAGMASPNFLKLVIEDKRNLGPSSVGQFARALDLATREREFFRELVAFNQATSAAEKNEHFERLGKYRKHRKVHKLDRDMFDYLSHWYYPAIRELVNCDGFQEDPQWIADHILPRISMSQAQQGLEILLTLGLIIRDDAGRIQQGDSLVSTGPEVRSLAVGNFHRQMIARAADSIEAVEQKDREISGVTVALSQKGFSLLKQKIHELRAELLELSELEKSPTRVVQFNFQAFPLGIIKEEETT